VKFIILNSSKHEKKSFEIDYICNLVDKFYPQNFIEFPTYSENPEQTGIFSFENC